MQQREEAQGSRERERNRDGPARRAFSSQSSSRPLMVYSTSSRYEVLSQERVEDNRPRLRQGRCTSAHLP
jgi:hypothetical protein